MNNHDMINLEVRLIVIEFLIMIDIDGYFTISDGINRGQGDFFEKYFLVRINNRHKFF